MTVLRTVLLRFTEVARAHGTHSNLSAVRSDGPVLWVAGDETATVERLTADVADAPVEFTDQVSFPLADLVDLPGTDAEEEADVEGLGLGGGYLWVVGSHSLRRKKIKAKHTGDAAIRRLARVTGQANRQIVARIPIDDSDLPRLVREHDGRRAAVFHGLRDLLRDDEHLAPFLDIPGKDNGLDVEGIAVHGDSVYLGLRGPVLRGWAVVLELRPSTDDDTPGRLQLTKLDDGARYRKHVLDLGGLGVRDLCPAGYDLLVLAGPSMDLDGPVTVFRWHGAAHTDQPQVVRGDALTREVDLPYGEGTDHAEGIGIFGDPADRTLLVVYDSPHPDRHVGGDGVHADIVRMRK